MTSLSSTVDQPILIIGLGSIGRRHLRNLRTLGFSKHVFLRSHKGARPIDNSMDVMEEGDIRDALRHQPNIAIVSNPTAFHLGVSIEAAKAGCHLFIEKPLANDLAGVEELTALTKERLITMIGCQFRFHPLLISLRNQINGGRIGTVLSAHAEWGEYLPGWHPDKDHRLGYSAREELGGGAILTLIHPLDYLYWLFGNVKRVHAFTNKIPSLETNTPDDLAEITLEFCSGVIGHVHLDYIQRPPVHRLKLLGEKGKVEWDYYAGTLSWESVEGTVDVAKVPDGFERNTMFLDEMRHFLECVKLQKPTSIPLEDGIAVLQTAIAAKRSLHVGRG